MAKSSGLLLLAAVIATTLHCGYGDSLTNNWQTSLLQPDGTLDKKTLTLIVRSLNLAIKADEILEEAMSIIEKQTNSIWPPIEAKDVSVDEIIFKHMHANMSAFVNESIAVLTDMAEFEKKTNRKIGMDVDGLTTADLLGSLVAYAERLARYDAELSPNKKWSSNEVIPWQRRSKRQVLGLPDISSTLNQLMQPLSRSNNLADAIPLRPPTNLVVNIPDLLEPLYKTVIIQPAPPANLPPATDEPPKNPPATDAPPAPVTKKPLLPDLALTEIVIPPLPDLTSELQALLAKLKPPVDKKPPTDNKPPVPPKAPNEPIDPLPAPVTKKPLLLVPEIQLPELPLLPDLQSQLDTILAKLKPPVDKKPPTDNKPPVPPKAPNEPIDPLPAPVTKKPLLLVPEIQLPELPLLPDLQSQLDTILAKLKPPVDKKPPTDYKPPVQPKAPYEPTDAPPALVTKKPLLTDLPLDIVIPPLPELPPLPDLQSQLDGLFAKLKPPVDKKPPVDYKPPVPPLPPKAPYEPTTHKPTPPPPAYEPVTKKPLLPGLALPELPLPQLPQLPLPLPQLPPLALPQQPPLALPQLPPLALPPVPQLDLPQLPDLLCQLPLDKVLLKLKPDINCKPPPTPPPKTTYTPPPKTTYTTLKTTYTPPPETTYITTPKTTYTPPIRKAYTPAPYYRKADYPGLYPPPPPPYNPKPEYLGPYPPPPPPYIPKVELSN